MQRIVPVLIAVFLGVVGLSAYSQFMGSRDESLSDQKSDLDMVATLLAERLGNLISPTGGSRTLPDAFAMLAPPGALGNGRRLLIADGGGRVLHATHAGPEPSAFIDEAIIGVQPLVTFGERAGVLPVRLENGEQAFAAARRVAAADGQSLHLFAVQGANDALLHWRTRAQAFVTLFLTLGGVVAALGVAFYVASARSRQVDEICHRMTTRIDTALAEARSGLWEWDLARGRIFWSDSMYELIGLERTGEVLAFGDINHLINREDGDLFALVDRLMADRSEATEHEFRMRHSDGHWVWLRARLQLIRDIDASYPRLIGVVIDVTEQKQFEEMTRRADVRLSDAINSISEAFVLWDHENRLVLCNSKFRTLHGLAPEDVAPGTRYETLIPAAEKLGGIHVGGERRELGARVYEAQLHDGRWLQVSERRTRDGGFVAVGMDITSHKDQEAKLIESRRQLIESVADLHKSRRALQAKTEELERAGAAVELQRQAAVSASQVKTDFLANMSHELKTPLNAIIGFSEMMEQKLFGELGSRHYEEYVALIRRSGSTLLSIINDILEMSRIEAGKVQIETTRIGVDTVVTSVVELVAEEADARTIDIEIDTRPGLDIDADARAVKQALAQLLRNAIKFTPSGGRAAVRIRKALGGVNIFIEDTGVGIAPSNLQKFGRPFEIMDGKLINGNKGSGLGVAIAKSLVELQGGGLRVRSWVGAGTIVMVHLPLAARPDPEFEPDRAAA